jgi:hypothetical protein
MVKGVRFTVFLTFLLYAFMTAITRYGEVDYRICGSGYHSGPWPNCVFTDLSRYVINAEFVMTGDLNSIRNKEMLITDNHGENHQIKYWSIWQGTGSSGSPAWSGSELRIPCNPDFTPLSNDMIDLVKQFGGNLLLSRGVYRLLTKEQKKQEEYIATLERESKEKDDRIAALESRVTEFDLHIFFSTTSKRSDYFQDIEGLTIEQ